MTQDTKVEFNNEIESLKKTQAEKKLEMKNLDYQTKKPPR